MCNKYFSARIFASVKRTGQFFVVPGIELRKLFCNSMDNSNIGLCKPGKAVLQFKFL